MTSRSVRILNQTGLHARPAGLFAETAKAFRSSIKVFRAGKEANGKSVLSLMLLEVTPGSELTIQADGEDEAEAVRHLAEVVEGGLGETARNMP